MSTSMYSDRRFCSVPSVFGRHVMEIFVNHRHAMIIPENKPGLPARGLHVSRPGRDSRGHLPHLNSRPPPYPPELVGRPDVVAGQRRIAQGIPLAMRAGLMLVELAGVPACGRPRHTETALHLGCLRKGKGTFGRLYHLRRSLVQVLWLSNRAGPATGLKLDEINLMSKRVRPREKLPNRLEVPVYSWGQHAIAHSRPASLRVMCAYANLCCHTDVSASSLGS
ncbi:hypothetical protein B0T26DRAFT_364745 [Lasiosphaeria miniovina]|uniref:Uncharacterized protein n=1 Tax=Lasiosphaeria miniovina TaxID=1954250 RepID=A0AA40ACR6_9PEZI|nr:uncharacterized protein B0T26DRAFT_364745 [Lasiosphaeria miniovina]KAK0713445.1 hypothetical protein B0T26DRAFT_364745 [Lasiosphaeria miniovina]